MRFSDRSVSALKNRTWADYGLLRPEEWKTQEYFITTLGSVFPGELFDNSFFRQFKCKHIMNWEGQDGILERRYKVGDIGKYIADRLKATP